MNEHNLMRYRVKCTKIAMRPTCTNRCQFRLCQKLHSRI